MKDTYIIGDVHGCYYTLKTLLSQLPKDARIIFAGDLCDKGLHTAKVIELVMKKGYECVKGNHELLMIEFGMKSMTGEDYDNYWVRTDTHGGHYTIQSYADDIELLTRHLEWIKSLPLYIEIDHYFITHAFALPYHKRRDEEVRGLTSNRLEREGKWGHDWENGWQEYSICNVFGHAAYKEPYIGDNFYGIDTGCVYGNKLTALNLNTRELISIETDPKDHDGSHKFFD